MSYLSHPVTGWCAIAPAPWAFPTERFAPDSVQVPFVQCQYTFYFITYTVGGLVGSHQCASPPFLYKLLYELGEFLLPHTHTLRMRCKHELTMPKGYRGWLYHGLNHPRSLIGVSSVSRWLCTSSPSSHIIIHTASTTRSYLLPEAFRSPRDL